MNKKKQIIFNLNNFLLAFSEALNSKKTTYIALNLALKINFSKEKLADICSFSLAFPLGIEALNNLDFVNKRNLEDRLFLDICNFSQNLTQNFDFSKNSLNQKLKCQKYVEEQNINQTIKNSFFEISNKLSFWLDLENDSEIVMFIYSNLDDFSKVLDFEEILKMTTQIHLFINKESKIIKIASKIADYFEFEHKDKQIFLIASTLQNIGKLYIPKTILEKKDLLNGDEIDILKSYPYHTKRVLNSIMGFNDICNLAYKVQERLDSSGSFALASKDLSFKDRLFICLVIYSALREKRAYREDFNHKEAIKIMKDYAKNRKIDESIVDIFEKIFEENLES